MSRRAEKHHDLLLEKHANIVWNWYENERNLPFPSEKTIKSLKWFVKNYPLPDYKYQGDWRGHMEYACDRMNGGRARAILRLLEEQK